MIVLFDGFCVLCSGFARWLKHQYEGKVQLKAMQSDEGQELMKKHGYPADDPDEVVVVDGQTSMSGASAVLYILKNGGRLSRFFNFLLRGLPKSWIRAIYRVVANNRYKWFGRRDSCTFIPD
ncbi:putative DCC family thiol-disulfide oxidoreductase YuxK [Marinilabilia salmonicolor]|jgi:predicted DCC family thiol-disulfide oxidoreductase YuxK|uniref:thiol-disulfide oxidoreductase DCC family protein n=1 Tax=Marinilabilia salmonicolor TaxID=989 RepID=UPI000D0690AA|nr:DCC1-like thiol-disulfide oxidoreductase family protein [Marinilabilia salmonicolor]PRZ00581.1 putative DCC family thiol-disulfide oxidoreductase YuxK [Marinilabilia salmonicolor]